MSTTTVTRVSAWAFSRVKDAFADLSYAQRRLFELRMERALARRMLLIAEVDGTNALAAPTYLRSNAESRQAARVARASQAQGRAR